MLRSKPPSESDGDGVLEVGLCVEPQHEWRMRMLSNLGFEHFAAFRLSVAGADWHECERLLAAGCSHELVLDLILD